MRDVVLQLRNCLHSDLPAIFCTTVETRGSTPQKAGSVMLVLPDGGQFGTLGGGCVEAEVRRKSLAMFGQQCPHLVDCTLDSESAWADGLICGGRMRFVLQPIASDSARRYFSKFAEMVLSGEGGCEVIFSEPGPCLGNRMLLNGRMAEVGRLDLGSPASSAERLDLPPIDARPKARMIGPHAFLPILPRCRLTIVGAGHVGQAVAELAAKVDFDIQVVDDREAFANLDRFPMASSLLVGSFEESLRWLELGPRDYCLIMTRGHGHDAEALRLLADKPARYLGLIGSRRKIRMIFEDLQRHGIAKERLAKVHAPIGIHIGSETVAEIAVSVVAQLIGHRNLGPESFAPQDHFGDGRR